MTSSPDRHQAGVPRCRLNGGKVLAVRRDDIPGKESVAAILRYAPLSLESGPGRNRTCDLGIKSPTGTTAAWRG